MSNITEIQGAILALPEADYLQFRQWFNELHWAKWDRQIESDSESGKLDFLIAEAREAKEKGYVGICNGKHDEYDRLIGA